tara:strand:- start:1500 stop:1814 length:315 start_codon:yes stop_codon:yes gene_type:complete
MMVIEMKNKKAMTAFGLITTAIVSMLLLLIFVGPVLKDIFVDKQVAFAGGKTEAVTKDCDGDTVMGFSDQCPCDASKRTLKGDERCAGTPDIGSENICPKLCKT